MSLKLLTIDNILSKDDDINDLIDILCMKNYYTVCYTYSCPTGGDWCDHSSLLIITGKYQEAKNVFDKYNAEPASEYRDASMDYYCLSKGGDMLESVFFDNTQEDINKRKSYKKHEDVQLVDYEIKYPLFVLQFEGGYDSIDQLGVYNDIGKVYRCLGYMIISNSKHFNSHCLYSTKYKIIMYVNSKEKCTISKYKTDSFSDIMMMMYGNGPVPGILDDEIELIELDI